MTFITFQTLSTCSIDSPVGVDWLGISCSWYAGGYPFTRGGQRPVAEHGFRVGGYEFRVGGHIEATIVLNLVFYILWAPIPSIDQESPALRFVRFLLFVCFAFMQAAQKHQKKYMVNPVYRIA